jgi:hypothetical protein
LPVTKIELDHGVNAGIEVRSLAAGIVPIHEEHEARLERGLVLDAWLAMDEREKALIIASRRIRNAIHNLQEEAQIKQAEKNAKRQSRR